MNKIEYENLSAYHPGYYIAELLEDLEMKQEELAKRLTITPKNLSDLINGKASISENIAKNLSLMLGTSADIWLELQKKYDLKVIEIKALKDQANEIQDLEQIDYSYFVKLGVVSPTPDKIKQVSSLFKYFAISSFSVFKKPDFLVQFRQTQAIDEKIILNSNAWVQTVINIGKQIETQPFSERKLKEYLPNIIAMTSQNPDEFLPRLNEIFAECGVAFVLIPSLKNSGVYGATKWINKEKVILGITNRGVHADIFWFSLMHEIGHVFQKKITKTIVDFDAGNSQEDFEKDADTFAKNALIPEIKYNLFVRAKNFSEQKVRDFAKSINIHPGIVVGRLQKEGLLPFTHLNKIKQKFIISN